MPKISLDTRREVLEKAQERRIQNYLPTSRKLSLGTFQLVLSCLVSIELLLIPMWGFKIDYFNLYFSFIGVSNDAPIHPFFRKLICSL